MKRDDAAGLESKLLEAINFVNETVNVSKKLNTFQAIDAVTTIVAEYALLKVEEIVKALNNGRTGKYGEIYRLDIGVICSWIDAYVNGDRENALEEKRKEKKSETLLLEAPQLSDEKVKFYMDQIVKIAHRGRDKKEKEKVVFDEKYFKESFQNNLPLLSEDDLKEWKKTLSKDEKLKDLHQLILDEIDYRNNKAK